MTEIESANLTLVRDFLTALSAGEAGPTLSRFFTPDAVQHELPNKLNPNGQTSDLPTMLERSERGKQLLQAQEYRLHSAVASGDLVAVEAEWVGTLAVSLATIPPGGQLRARMAVFFECREGKIWRQRNYDCFDPW